MPRAPCVYMMASKRNRTLYTGVTSNLAQRAFQHREGLTPGFYEPLRMQAAGLL